MPDTYTQSFDNVCQVTILGTAHGFRGVSPRHLRYLHAGAIPAPLWPTVLTIAPDTQDITFAFLVPTSGHVYVSNPDLVDAVAPRDPLLALAIARREHRAKGISMPPQAPRQLMIDTLYANEDLLTTQTPSSSMSIQYLHQTVTTETDAIPILHVWQYPEPYAKRYQCTLYPEREPFLALTLFLSTVHFKKTLVHWKLRYVGQSETREFDAYIEALYPSHSPGNYALGLVLYGPHPATP